MKSRVAPVVSLCCTDISVEFLNGRGFGEVHLPATIMPIASPYKTVRSQCNVPCLAAPWMR